MLELSYEKKMTNVSQNVLTKQIVAYLNLTCSQEVKPSLFYEKVRQYAKKGLCFAYVVVHAYMHGVGKLNWWKDLLISVASWDGTADGLLRKVTLKDAQPDSVDCTQGDLLNRFTHYILYNHASNDLIGLELGDGFDQKKFLHVGDYFFASEKIVNHVVASGYMDDETLRKILIPDVFSQNKTLFIIQNFDHGCSFRFDQMNDRWIFYDPNDPDGEQTFSTLNDFIQCVCLRLGFHLAITVSSFTQENQLTKISNCYKGVLARNPISLMKGLGLHVIACHAPEIMDKLIELAEDNADVCTALASALPLQNKDDFTAVHIIARYAPKSMGGLFALARGNRDVWAVLVRVLLLQNKDDFTGLHMIARYAPKSMDELFALARGNPDVCAALASALTLQIKEGSTGLHVIAGYAPESMRALIPLAKDNADVCAALASALSLQDQDGFTGLHVIAAYVPESMPALIALAKDNADVCAALARALLLQDIDSFTGLHVIAGYAPESLGELVELARDKADLCAALASALPLQAEDGFTGLHMILCYAESQIGAFLSLLEKTGPEHAKFSKEHIKNCALSRAFCQALELLSAGKNTLLWDRFVEIGLRNIDTFVALAEQFDFFRKVLFKMDASNYHLIAMVALKQGALGVLMYALENYGLHKDYFSKNNRSFMKAMIDLAGKDDAFCAVFAKALKFSNSLGETVFDSLRYCDSRNIKFNLEDIFSLAKKRPVVDEALIVAGEARDSYRLH
jgi:hypothetical protein